MPSAMHPQLAAVIKSYSTHQASLRATKTQLVASEGGSQRLVAAFLETRWLRRVQALVDAFPLAVDHIRLLESRVSELEQRLQSSEAPRENRASDAA